MERSINIENGGTLTDICVWDGTEFTVTKTLTTPFDLSQRLFDGITKASAVIYGRPALSELLHSTKHIRCSTTQGTNALVEPKGTRIGLITDDIAVVGELRGSAAERAVVDDLVGDRVAAIDVELSDKELAGELVRQVNRLTTDGAARLVVAAGNGVDGAERRIRRILVVASVVRADRLAVHHGPRAVASDLVERAQFLPSSDGGAIPVQRRGSAAQPPGQEPSADLSQRRRVLPLGEVGFEQTRKGPTMLSSVLGMLAMVPVVFGVAGYAMVSR